MLNERGLRKLLEIILVVNKLKIEKSRSVTIKKELEA